MLLYLRHDLDAAEAAAQRAVEGAGRYELGLLVPATTMVVAAMSAVAGRREQAVASVETALPLADPEVQASGHGNVL